MSKYARRCGDCGSVVVWYSCDACDRELLKDGKPPGPGLTITAAYESAKHDGDRADFCDDACFDAWCAKPPEERKWQDGMPVIGVCEHKG